jgi:hypothetical protein
MLFQSLRALCLAPGGPGSIWNHLEAPVWSTGVSGRFACGFQTDLHFADVLTLCSYSFYRLGRERVALWLAYIGGQYYAYV